MMKQLTQEQVRDAVNNSGSLRQAIISLGLSYGGATVKRFTSLAEGYGIPLDFPRAYQQQEIPLEQIMVAGSEYTNNRIRLKARILAAGLLTNECAICGLGPEWQGKPLTLQLDHINGKNNDHRIENLRILCPNCHTQTDTYAGKSRSIQSLPDDSA
jgi:hypothetical protein